MTNDLDSHYGVSNDSNDHGYVAYVIVKSSSFVPFMTHHRILT